MTATPPHLYRKAAQERGVAPDTIDRAIAQAAAPESRGLPAILTLGHLAHSTGAGFYYLRSIVKREHDGYHAFLIKKRSGGRRLIASPEPTLLEVQRWIATNILNKLAAHPASVAYAPGSSTLKCAKRHVGAKWLVKIDIHDFFESISERRVYFVFRESGYQPLVAFELARLCTRVIAGQPKAGEQWREHRTATLGQVYPTVILGHLPQGAPTSPMLSNLVSRQLDAMLEQLAKDRRLSFTRYSDDIVFSAGDEFSHAKATDLIAHVGRILKSFGHALHHKKTSISPPGARKIVLGFLVDDDSVRFTSEFRRRLRDHVRGIEKFGLVSHATSRKFSSIWGLVRHVQGLIAYARSVDAPFASECAIRLSAALTKERWRNT